MHHDDNTLPSFASNSGLIFTPQKTPNTTFICLISTLLFSSDKISSLVYKPFHLFLPRNVACPILFFLFFFSFEVRNSATLVTIPWILSSGYDVTYECSIGIQAVKFEIVFSFVLYVEGSSYHFFSWYSICLLYERQSVRFFVFSPLIFCFTKSSYPQHF